MDFIIMWEYFYWQHFTVCEYFFQCNDFFFFFFLINLECFLLEFMHVTSFINGVIRSEMKKKELSEYALNSPWSNKQTLFLI